MGKDTRSSSLNKVGNTAGTAYNNLQSGPTNLETKLGSQSSDMWNTYRQGLDTQKQDYSNIMGNYQDYVKNIQGPGRISAGNVSVNRPEELTKAYGYLNQAAPGYQNFADTGGYSPTDIQELRARGSAPITSAYSNAMMEMNRARALGGSSGSPNYISALSRMQRELPQQLATATTGVNASLADAIRQGKLSGLAGLTGIGGEMGGLAGAESGRQLQAGIANQGAGLQAAQLNQQGELGALSGMNQLYGTTPAMAATFGNQALNSTGQELTAEQLRNQLSTGLLNTQTSAYGNMTPQKSIFDKILGAAGSVVPYLGGLGGLGKIGAGMAGPAINGLPDGQRTMETGIPGMNNYMNDPNYYNQPGVNITEGQGSGFWG